VRGGACGLAGIAADPAAKFDRIKSFDDRRSGLAQRFDSWQALFGHWQRCIDGLAGEIVRGECDNAVYDPQCLSYAGLDILLRRAEGVADPGAILLVCHPAMKASLSDDWLAELARRTGREIRIEADPALALEAGFAQAVTS